MEDFSREGMICFEIPGSFSGLVRYDILEFVVNVDKTLKLTIYRRSILTTSRRTF